MSECGREMEGGREGEMRGKRGGENTHFVIISAE